MGEIQRMYDRKSGMDNRPVALAITNTFLIQKYDYCLSKVTHYNHEADPLFQ